MATVPIYHSLPGAPASLYLDFDGHFEPVWGNHNNVTTPPYDSDGDPALYNAAELVFIENVWKAVAEDYAPFRIDVTTEQPPSLAPGVPIGQANGVALRVAIGGSSTDWYGGTWAGVAHQDSFTNGVVNTAYAFSVFATGVDTNPISIGRAVSHEAGHAFGLAHQSQYDTAGVKLAEYLPPLADWAAIMGAGTRELVTWHNGQSADGASIIQDDIAVIGRAANGFGFRADEHGNTIATATSLGGNGPYWAGAGLIGSTSDTDMFSFTTGAARELRISVDGASQGQNLDAVLELYNAQGALVESANPSDSLDATLVRSLAAGTYYVAVKSDGRYGRVGQYSLTVGPIVSVSVADLATAEGNTGQQNATFTVTLSDPLIEPLTVSYATSDGTALSGSDYLARSGTLTFAPGVVTQTVSVPLVGDTQVEADERFFLRITVPASVTLADGEALGTIINDDTAVVGAVSPEEQLFVYLLNRARHDPVAFQQEHSLPVDLSAVEPRPPLAVSEGLFASARFHAGEMATNNYFAHQSALTGKWPNQIAREHGYPLPPQFLDGVNNIESIAAGTARDTAEEVLTSLIGDSSSVSLGHRSLLLGIGGFANYREIGIGHSFNAASDYDHYWSIQSAYNNSADRFLTGVAFDDRNGNSRYDLDEGLAGVQVTATTDGAGSLVATTNLAGGWAIKVGAAGTYQVTASGGQFAGAAEQTVIVGNGSVEVDFISGRTSGIVEFGSPRITAPSGLAATVQAANRVRLAWTDQATTETSYRIERATDGVNFSLLANLPANSTNYQDVGLQSNIAYSYRVRAIGLQAQSDPSNIASATPPLTTITGTSGNDTYHVLRTGSLLQIYENTPPSGSPTYSSELAAMGGTLTIDTLAGNDTLTVSTSGEPLGIGQLIYNAGAGGNNLIVDRGSARIDSTAVGGTLNTTVNAGSSLATTWLQQNNLTLGENSKLTLLPDGGTSVVTSLTLSPSSIVDIGNNALVINYGGASPAATVRARILAGRGGPGLEASWTGAGITSSAAAQANAADPEKWSVGYAENSALPLGPYATFRGIAADATSVLIAYTRTGDANLDGLVNDDDVTIIGATYAPATAQAHWALGDFDYNGFVSDDDVTLLGAFYQPGAGAAGAPQAAVLGMVAWSPDTVVTWSPDHATASTAGLPASRILLDTFGHDNVRGQETRAQLLETRAQLRVSRAQLRAHRAQPDAALIDLLAEDIAAGKSKFSRMRVAPVQRR